MAASRPPPPRLALPSTRVIVPKAKTASFEDWPEPGLPLATIIDLESLKGLIGLEDVRGNAFRSSYKRQQITFYSSFSDSTLHSSTFKEMFTSAQNFQRNLRQRSKNSVWWIDVHNPSDDTLRLLCSAFRVHPLTAEDICMQETREKMETFPLYYFACLQTFNTVSANSKTSYAPHTIYMVVFKEGTLSFSFGSKKHSTNVLERMEKLRGLISVTRNWIFYAIVDDIVDSFAAPIAQIESEVEVIDDNIYEMRIEDVRDFLITVENVRARMSDLMQLLHTKTDVLKAFSNHYSEEKHIPEGAPPSEDILMYISDVQDHVVTMIASLEWFEDLLGREQENCVAYVGIRHDIQRRRLIQFATKVAVLTIILTFMSLICSLFSTNVSSNAKLYQSDSLKAFWTIVAVEFVVGGTLLYVAKKYKWF